MGEKILVKISDELGFEKALFMSIFGLIGMGIGAGFAYLLIPNKTVKEFQQKVLMQILQENINKEEI